MINLFSSSNKHSSERSLFLTFKKKMQLLGKLSTITWLELWSISCNKTLWRVNIFNAGLTASIRNIINFQRSIILQSSNILFVNNKAQTNWIIFAPNLMISNPFGKDFSLPFLVIINLPLKALLIYFKLTLILFLRQLTDNNKRIKIVT